MSSPKGDFEAANVPSKSQTMTFLGSIIYVSIILQPLKALEASSGLMTMTKNILAFFDKLEDKTRAKLSHLPILYAFLGGVGIVLFWRGIWHSTDFLTAYLLGQTPVTLFGVLDGPISFIIGTIILLITGVYVSAFIGNRLIITGLSGDKKLAEKTADEIMTSEDQVKKLQKTLDKVENKLEHIEEKLK